MGHWGRAKQVNLVPGTNWMDDWIFITGLYQVVDIGYWLLGICLLGTFPHT